MNSTMTIITLTAIFLTPSIAEESFNAIEEIEGYWELDSIGTEDRGSFTCEDRPLQITISEDKRTYYSKRWTSDKTSTSPILWAEDDTFYIQYLDEDRLDDEGVPVSWYLIMVDKDHFYWVRDDWVTSEGTIEGATPRRSRCKEPPAIG